MYTNVYIFDNNRVVYIKLSLSTNGLMRSLWSILSEILWGNTFYLLEGFYKIA